MCEAQSVYTFANWKTHEGVKSERQEIGDTLSPRSLMKSISFPVAAVSNRIFRTCLDGAIQEVVMLPLNGVSFNSRVTKLLLLLCTVSINYLAHKLQ